MWTTECLSRTSVSLFSDLVDLWVITKYDIRSNSRSEGTGKNTGGVTDALLRRVTKLRSKQNRLASARETTATRHNSSD